MICKGIRDMAIRKIVLPGDIKDRMKKPHVRALAETIRTKGVIYPPLVRHSPRTLIAGADRIAALLILDRHVVSVKVYDCTDAELDMLRQMENAHRRHEPEEAAKAMAILEQRMLEVEAELPPAPRTGPGRPKSKRVRALEVVAAEEGVTPEAIRMRKWRAEQKQEKAIPTPEAMAELPPPVKPLGMVLDPGFSAKVVALQQVVDSADISLRRALANLTELGKLPLSQEGPISRVYEHLSEAGAMLRDLRPEALCPWCKGLPGVIEKCAACIAAGYVGKRKLRDAPPELIDEGTPRVVVAGEAVLAATVLAAMPQEEDPWDLG